MVLQRCHLAQGGPRTKSQRAGSGEGELTLPLAWRCVSPSIGSQLPRPPGGHSSGWPLRSPSHPWGKRDIRGGAISLLPGKGEGCRAPQKLTEGQLLFPQPLPLAVADCEDLVTAKQSPPSALIGTWVGHKCGEQMLFQARSPSSPQEGGSKHGSPPAPSQKALPRIHLSCSGEPGGRFASPAPPLTSGRRGGSSAGPGHLSAPSPCGPSRNLRKREGGLQLRPSSPGSLPGLGASSLDVSLPCQDDPSPPPPSPRLYLRSGWSLTAAWSKRRAPCGAASAWTACSGPPRVLGRRETDCLPLLWDKEPRKLAGSSARGRRGGRGPSQAHAEGLAESAALGSAESPCTTRGETQPSLALGLQGPEGFACPPLPCT